MALSQRRSHLISEKVAYFRPDRASLILLVIGLEHAELILVGDGKRDE